MKHRSRLGLYWAGVICAFIASWLAVGFLVAFSMLLPDGWHSALFYCAWAAWLLVSLLAIPFVVGLICVFFWHPVASAQTLRNWGAWFMLILLAPLFIGGPLALLIVIFLYALLIIPFLAGVERGEEWWPKRRWRHFFDITNDWEREDGEG